MQMQPITSVAELNQRLLEYKNRAKQVCGRWLDGRPLAEVIMANFDRMIKDNSEVKAEDRAKFLRESINDPAKRQQLCAIRLEQANNYIVATQNIIPFFFETVVLGEPDRPGFQNNTMNEVRVRYIGQDGASKTWKVPKDQTEVLIDLHLLSTDEVRYKKRDLYNGNVIESAMATINLAYDMTNQQEAKAWGLLQASVNAGGAYGAFTFTGNRETRVYVPNSRIRTELLPTTNDISLSDNGTGAGQTNKFRYSIFKAIEQYANKWKGAFPGGDLLPTGRVLVPGAEASDLADAITPTGSTNNPIANELLTQGWSVVQIHGRTWTLVVDNTIAPGAVYAEFNRKVGQAFLKPSMDTEEVVTTAADRRNNDEARYQQKVFGAYINNVNRVATLRVRYSSAYDPNDP